MFCRVLLVLWLAAALPALFAQEPSVPAGADAVVRGGAVIAERYANWAAAAVSDGRWDEALAALERAQDFADVSSDLSYLLALVRFHENRPKGAVLDAVRRSLDTDRWNQYSPVQARLLEAEALLSVRAFTETLRILGYIPDAEAARYGADIACLRLRALLGRGAVSPFQSAMTLALEQHARDPRPVRILFRYAAHTAVPDGTDRDMVATILKRLPLLLNEAPDLAYLAAPFMGDTEEAARLVSAYRTSGGAAQEAIPAALNLGVIDEDRAVEELFREKTLDKGVVFAVWNLLRSPGGRANFRRNLAGYSGVIQEDLDYDGYPEAQTRYEHGSIEEYMYDADQDGLVEWRVFWDAGIPARADIVLSEESGTQDAGLVRSATGLPLRDGDLARVSVVWERYPAVLRADFSGITYRFSIGKFMFNPFLIGEIPGSGGIFYPDRDPRGARLTRRSLVFFAADLERPSREFQGAVERVTLERGIPQRAVEYLDGRVASSTEFMQGRPVVQYIDVDLDGRMETIRRFRIPEGAFGGGDSWGYAAVLDSSESDWDGDGVYETGEEYLPDGSTVRSWDLNKDGKREYEAAVPGPR
ncbi:MAG: hypothetical protein LBH70_10230 [Spirochaetaceae bacterium]|nr:hypothetical protein [Spirochaetaceae bacterium]